MRTFISTSKMLIVALLLSAAATSVSAQSEPGLHVGLSAGSTNLNRDQRMIFKLSPEVLYMGDRLGIGARYNTTVNLYKNSKVPYHNPKGRATSAALTGYVRLFSVDALDIIGTTEVSYSIEEIDKKMASPYQFTPGLVLALPVYNRLGARFSVGQTFYRQGYQGVPTRKNETSGYFGLTYNFSKND